MPFDTASIDVAISEAMEKLAWFSDSQAKAERSHYEFHAEGYICFSAHWI